MRQAPLTRSALPARPERPSGPLFGHRRVSLTGSTIACGNRRPRDTTEVLIVDSWQAFGGCERYVLHVVEGLGRRGVKFSVAGVHDGLLERAAGAGARPLRMRHVTRQRTTFAVIKQVLMWPLLLLDYASLLRRAGRPADVHITTL